MPRISHLYFKTAILFFVAGICIGLKMAISGDQSVIGAHAHANLLGWVSMAIFGGYHALNPRKAEWRLAMVQYAIYTFGVALLVPALYLMLEGNMAMEPVVGIASMITFAGVLLFGYIVFASSETAKSPLPAPAE